MVNVMGDFYFVWR